jgi:hypothetical protein
MTKSGKTETGAASALESILMFYAPAANWQEGDPKSESQLLELIHYKASREELRWFMRDKGFLAKIIAGEPFWRVVVI